MLKRKIEKEIMLWIETGEKALLIYVYINNDLFGGTFRRDYEGDYHCSVGEVRGMLRDQAERGMDNKILLNMGFDAFDFETVRSFRTRHTAVNPDHVWHKLDDMDYLERIGAAAISDADGRLHPTVAGLLMFGEEYKIRYEFPEYFLDYREMLDPSIRWTDRLESSSGDWSGNIFDFFFHMERKLLRDLKKPFKLVGITRVDETPIHKAIREALANCLANADFNFPRGIVITKNPNAIIIENPGSIIIGKAQMLRGGVSEPRNKVIMKMFNLVRIGERAGSGVPDIFDAWEEAGWIPPTVEEQYKPDRTILTLIFEEKQAFSDNKTGLKSEKQAFVTLVKNLDVNAPTKENIIKLFQQFGMKASFSRKDVMETVGITATLASNLLRRLKEFELIEPVSGIGRGRYMFAMTKQE